jgi:hypothetical protein
MGGELHEDGRHIGGHINKILKIGGHLWIIEMGGELHEDGRHKGGHIVGEGLDKGTEAQHARVMQQRLILCTKEYKIRMERNDHATSCLS